MACAPTRQRIECVETRIHRVWLLFAVLLSGALWFFGTGFAPVPALTWLAPLPILLLAPRTGAWTAVGAALLAQLLGTTNSWAFYTGSHDVPLPMGLLISLTFAVVFALAVTAFRALVVRGRAMLAALAAPVVWVGAMYLVSLNPYGIVGTLAATQTGAPVLLQLASVTGAWGVEFLVLFAPAALAASCAPGVLRPARLRTGALLVLVFATVLGAGAFRLDGTGEQGQRVALLAHRHAEWGVRAGTPEARELAEGYTRRIDALPADVRTAVLPEGTFAASDAQWDALLAPLARAARDNGVTVVLGVAHERPTFQTAVVLPGNAGAPRVYRKHHDDVGAPGTELTFVAGTRAGVQICADLDHPDPSRDYAAAGARTVLSPAADEGENGWQHSRNGLLRGVEHGFSIAWSGRASRLLLADGYGRVRAETETGGSGEFRELVAPLPEGPGETPYAALGDWFAWLCLAGCGALTMSALTIRLRTARCRC